MTKAHSKELRGKLKEAVTQLYAKLLLYQIRACVTTTVASLRDLVKLEN
jgi:hypothetical protein